MKKFLNMLLLSLFLLILVFIPVKAKASEKVLPCNKATCDLRMLERDLWTEHVFWTRNFIVSDLTSLEDKEAVTERLLKNQEAIGNAIKPYYGEEAGNKLTSLLKEHIILAAQVTDAAKSGKSTDLEKYNKLWYDNADQIADFLSAANPNYSNQVLKDSLHKHLQFVTDQVVTRLNQDWNGDIKAFDEGKEHMMHFADMLTDGIIKQFPKKFK